MVIYLHNKHIGPLLEALNLEPGYTFTQEHYEAVTALELAIEQEKQKPPYRLWLRANQPQEKTA